MAAAHIAIAQGKREVDGRTGPRAAFDFYMSQGIPTARAAQAEIRSAGNKKAQFSAYCAKFGEQFGKVNGNGAVRSNEQVEEVRENGLIARVAKRLGVSATKLAELVEDDEEAVETPAPAKTREIPTPKRISFPMAMAVKKICTKSGADFEITDKSGKGATANYTVKVDGDKLTPKQASELIGAHKA